MDQNKNSTSPFAKNEHELFQRKLKNKENIKKYINKMILFLQMQIMDLIKYLYNLIYVGFTKAC